MNEPGIDLTGKLIIKTALGDDIRRILITNEDITYDELILMMQRVYRGKLTSTDDIVIKYKDDDNDLITIFDSSDLSFAIQCSRILKITLFVNGKPEPIQSDEKKHVIKELRHIRDCCTALLDNLIDHTSPDGPTSTSNIDSTAPKAAPSKVSTDSPRQVSPAQASVAPSGAGSKEFDPLSSQRSVDDQQNKVMSSFGISSSDASERAGTPDSVSSVGSASRQPHQPDAPPSQSGGSYGKVPPWQQQPGQVNPSAYSPGQQGFAPAGSPQHQGYRGQPQTSQAQGVPAQQQQQPQQPRAPVPGQPPQQPQQPQQGFLPPGAAGSQTSQQPQQGYGQPGTSHYAGYPAQSGQVPANQPQQPGAQPGAQPGGQPSPYGYQQQPGPGQAPGPAQGPPGQNPNNPYARQGPGYSTGYPRPTGNYPQGYQ